MNDEASGIAFAQQAHGFLSGLQSDSARVRRAVTVYGVGMAAWATAKQAKKWWKDRYQYSVSVKGSEDIYDDVVRELTAMIPARNKRALLAAAYRDGRRIRNSPDYQTVYENGYRPTLRLGTHYDGNTAQTFTLEGHKVQVNVEREAMNYDEKMGGDRFFRNERLRFVTHQEDGRAAVVRWLESIIAQRDDADSPRFFILSRWGSQWERRNDLPARTLDSIILRAGLTEEIASDLDRFLSDRDEYLTRGWPYHRGYLFHGPGGTGKSSLAQALAGHFGLDLYFAPLGDLEKDANLLHLFSQVQPNSVLLLEDVDVYHATRTRDDAGEGVSLSGLLNALDGVSTPSGVITIMTTNDKTVLDRALVRKGRVDREYELDYLDTEQLGRLVESLVGTRVSLGPLTIADQVSPSDVIEEMKPHLRKPERGLGPIRAMLDTKRQERRNLRNA